MNGEQKIGENDEKKNGGGKMTTSRAAKRNSPYSRPCTTPEKSPSADVAPSFALLYQKLRQFQDSINMTFFPQYKISETTATTHIDAEKSLADCPPLEKETKINGIPPEKLVRQMTESLENLHIENSIDH